MIIGTGMMARCFAAPFAKSSDVLVFAAGVSNSQCRDDREYGRERARLTRALDAHDGMDRFVYFSTCSVEDPDARETPYVRHKLAMEALVGDHPGHIVFRLPQVAGATPNPHTLLNFLHARVARAERFAVWQNAHRNIIDCDDVRALGVAVIDTGLRGATINIANSVAYEVVEIVATMERVVRGHAVYDLIDRGSPYPIDIGAIRPMMASAGVSFGAGYLERVIRKYYGTPD